MTPRTASFPTPARLASPVVTSTVPNFAMLKKSTSTEALRQHIASIVPPAQMPKNTQAIAAPSWPTTAVLDSNLSVTTCARSGSDSTDDEENEKFFLAACIFHIDAGWAHDKRLICGNGKPDDWRPMPAIWPQERKHPIAVEMERGFNTRAIKNRKSSVQAAASGSDAFGEQKSLQASCAIESTASDDDSFADSGAVSAAALRTTASRVPSEQLFAKQHIRSRSQKTSQLTSGLKMPKPALPPLPPRRVMWKGSDLP